MSAGVAVSAHVTSTAIVLHGDERTEFVPEGVRAYRLRLLIDEAQRRHAMSEATCHKVAMAYEEGYRLAAERFLASFPGDIVGHLRILDQCRPSYTQIRNFLIGEYDADEVLACRVAHDRTVSANRFYGYKDKYDEYARARALFWL